jgi:hypothetical protein
MLVAAANVGRFCTPTLLALKQAGLEYLLLDEAQAHAIRNGAPEAAQQPESSGVRTVSQTPPRGALPRLEAKASQAAPAIADWPAVWQECLKKTRIAPVVWTYRELGLDLCGTPDPKRRELLQDLLKDLAHPPGTHSFWPFALPGQGGGDGEQQLEANVPIFWEGVRLLQGRAVVIMGSQALRSLALPDSMRALRPFQQVRHQGRLLIVLHSPDMLIQENRRIQALREFLRQALAPFA